jgi:hypothetical protein
MSYGYAETFLIVFLTHPGVIIPTSMFDLPPYLGAGWQTFWAWVLSLPGEKSAGFAWTMYVLYLVFLFVYMYFFINNRFQKGI